MPRSRIELLILLFAAIGVAASGGYLLLSRDVHKEASKTVALGTITPLGEDVRRRGELELSWNQIRKEDHVYSEDRIFTGARSQASVTLRKSRKFRVEPNSLIRITDQPDAPIFDFEQGSMFAELFKGSSMILKSKGRTAKISSDGAVIRIVTHEEGPRLIVLEGEASLFNEATNTAVSVKASEEALVQEQNIKVEPQAIYLQSPRPDEIIEAAPTDGITFRWERQKSISKPTPVELEVATDPSFVEVVLKQTTQSSLTSTHLKPGHLYFWRVRGEHETSSISMFSYKEREISPQAFEREPTSEEKAAPPKERPAVLVEKTTVSQQHEIQATEPQPLQETKINAPNELPTLPATSQVEPQTNDENSAPKGLPAFNSSEIPRLSFFLGLGASYIIFNQESSNHLEQGKFAKLKAPGISAGVSVKTSKHSQVYVQYDDRRGEFSKTSSTSIDKTNFEWITFNGEFQHILTESPFYRSWLLGGIQLQQIPLLSGATTNTTNLAEVAFTNGSAGGKLDYIPNEKYLYEAILRYQHPLSQSTSSGLPLGVKPRVMFDGSIGVLRKLSNGFSAGVFWYGQYLDYSYSSTREGVSSTGRSQLLNSNLHFRLRLEFMDF